METDRKHALVVMCEKASTSSAESAGTSQLMQNMRIQLPIVHTRSTSAAQHHNVH